MLRQNCRRGCRGACRCEYEYAICVTANGLNHASVPTPTEKGCPLVLTSSRLVVKCSCCPVIVAELNDILVMGGCVDTYLNLDLNDMTTFFNTNVNATEMRAADCALSYQLYVNGQPYLAGKFEIDWTFS